ncbi:MAG TPA: glycosyltransferase [Thermoanaerobaculaceae bacterium]|nr:glycosyltransferase [Thermoanaerobaculaceae bacterium]HRS15491.1 glycosyltransferase [Thermoanaerobaculaceae bacterium]
MEREGGSPESWHGARALVFGNVFQPPFVNNLIGPLRAFERACTVKLVEPRRLEGFVSTGAAAPAPLPVGPALEAVGGFEPDIVVCLAGAVFVPGELKAALPRSAVYVGLALSDPLGLEASLAIAPSFDLFYSHEPSCFAAYRAAGIPVRECAPAIDGELFAPLDAPKQWDVFFAGRWTQRRNEAVAALSRVCRVRLHGHAGESRWDPPALPPLDGPAELRAGIASALLALEFAVIDDQPPPALGIWRLTNRPQFAAACGVASLIEDHHSLARYFEPETEIVPYRSIPDLVERVMRLVGDPARCAELGRRARARALRQHLWDHRVAVILRDVEALLAGRSSGAGPGERHADE